MLSHPSEEGYEEKLLIEHLENVSNMMVEEVTRHSLDLSYSKPVILRLTEIVGLSHDLGKATVWFQEYIRKERKGSDYTHHSYISAIVTYYLILRELDDELLAYIAFQIVLRHHGNLSSFDISNTDINYRLLEKQFNNIREFGLAELSDLYFRHELDLRFINEICISDFKEVVEEFIDEYEELAARNEIEIFFLTNYVFSLLIDSDKSDAARLDNKYFSGNLDEGVEDIFLYIEECRQKNFDKFNPDIPLNKLRNRFLEDIYSNDSIKPENHFYSITSPTGIGKTFGCLVFANKLRQLLPERNARIIYCLPYTSIIDQNYKEFDKILKFSKGEKYRRRPTRYLLKHHYLNPKKISGRLDEERKTLKDYHDDVLFVESWKSTYIVTTFVQLFYALIGYRNRFLKKFHNIVNSIIILDEVQNIDPDYYKLLQEAFQVLGKKFGIYFLLITATQPEIIEKEGLVELTDSEYYMQSDIFDRVSLKLLIDVNDFDELIEEFGKLFLGSSALIVMNTKKMANDTYDKLRELHPDHTLICLTTNLLPYDRIRIIDEIKDLLQNKEKVIVVSTQLIEAGVDLSFEYVFRDMAPLDSIIQVAGRCNRNGEYGEGNGKMFLFDLNNNSIYKYTLIQAVKDILANEDYSSKDFYKLSKEYFSKLQFSSESKKIINAIKELNYDTEIRDQTPINKFKLINDEGKENIYILRTEDAQKYMDELIESKRKLLGELDKANKEKIQLQIENLKYELLPFNISLYQHEIDIYNQYLEPQEEIANNPDFPLKYLSYEFQKKYAYDTDIGFLKTPKREIENFKMW